MYGPTCVENYLRAVELNCEQRNGKGRGFQK